MNAIWISPSLSLIHILIDYKTDRVRGEETAERAESYARQLEAYAYAAQRMTGKPVRECVLYFLYSGETVKSSCK